MTYLYQKGPFASNNIISTYTFILIFLQQILHSIHQPLLCNVSSVQFKRLFQDDATAVKCSQIYSRFSCRCTSLFSAHHLLGTCCLVDSLLNASTLHNNKGERVGPAVLYYNASISADNTFHLLCLQYVSCWCLFFSQCYCSSCTP